MTVKEQKYCYDILLACERIESFLVGLHSFSDYESDFKTQSAIERQLINIGEAVNKL
jgi:uncharacterized protein with HEPN domain